jgi:hypothetical protein
MESFFMEDRFTYCPDGIKTTVPFGTEFNIDFKIDRSNMWITGGQIIYQNSCFGDYVQFQVIDKDNTLGYGENVVLRTFVTKWYLDPGKSSQVISPTYAAELFPNIYLRAIYTSTGTTDVSVCINYDLHHF